MLSSLYDSQQQSKRRGKQEQRKSTQPKATAEYRAEQRAKDKKHVTDKQAQLQAAALHSYKTTISKSTSNDNISSYPSSTTATVTTNDQSSSYNISKTFIDQPNILDTAADLYLPYVGKQHMSIPSKIRSTYLRDAENDVLLAMKNMFHDVYESDMPHYTDSIQPDYRHTDELDSELLALASIYEKNFQLLRNDEKATHWRIIQYNINKSMDDTATTSSTLLPEQLLFVLDLLVVHPSNYPVTSLPIILIQNDNVSASRKLHITRTLAQRCVNTSIGQPMTYDIIEYLKSNWHTLLAEPSLQQPFIWQKYLNPWNYSGNRIQLHVVKNDKYVDDESTANDKAMHESKDIAFEYDNAASVARHEAYLKSTQIYTTDHTPRLDESQRAPINVMKQDIMSHVFTYLDGHTLGRLSTVCFEWNCMLQDTMIWEAACQQVWVGSVVNAVCPSPLHSIDHNASTAHRNSKQLQQQQYIRDRLAALNERYEQYGCDWRHLYITRRHVRFDGYYLMETSYWRRRELSFGERDVGNVAKVTYYRYLFFTPNNTVYYALLNEFPLSSHGQQLTAQNSNNKLYKGKYSANGNVVSVKVDVEHICLYMKLLVEDWALGVDGQSNRLTFIEFYGVETVNNKKEVVHFSAPQDLFKFCCFTYNPSSNRNLDKSMISQSQAQAPPAAASISASA
jgi:hypothetical protein